MRFILVILLLSAPLLSRGLTPVTQPLPEAFADFQKNYPSRCDDLIAVVRSRIGPKQNKKIEERLEHLARYRDNLRADILEAQRAFAEPKDPAVLSFTLHTICTDLVGFRRSLDAVVLEASGTKALVVDEALLTKLRVFWDDEYYFSWRFGSEIAPRL